MNNKQLILIGASAGGINALQQIVERLPNNFSIPIIFVMHLSRNLTSALDSVVSRATALKTVKVEDGMKIKPGVIYVCVPNKNIEVEDGHIRLRENTNEDKYLPSVNVSIRSVAKEYDEGLVSIILSGVLDDGSDALKEIYPHKGVTLVQCPDEAQFPTMPEVAIDKDHPDATKTLSQIADFLLSLHHNDIEASEIISDKNKESVGKSSLT